MSDFSPYLCLEWILFSLQHLYPMYSTIVKGRICFWQQTKWSWGKNLTGTSLKKAIPSLLWMGGVFHLFLFWLDSEEKNSWIWFTNKFHSVVSMSILILWALSFLAVIAAQETALSVSPFIRLFVSMFYSLKNFKSR